MAGQTTHTTTKISAEKAQVFSQNPEGTVLGMLKKLFRKETGLYVLCVHESMWEKGTHIRQIFVKFQICNLYFNLTKHSNSITSRQK